MLLLCSTDASISGRAAIRVAAQLAERLHAALACPGVDAGDPSRRLLPAAHAAGCDLLVVGYASRSGIGTGSPPGWQRRVVRDVPCPVMLMPVGARGGGLVLGYGVPELPYQAAKAAGRLAGRLRTPLIITDILAGDRTLRVRPVEPEGGASDRLVRAATMHEAALVVIGGRWRGRGLLPRRGVVHGLESCNRLPVIVAAA